MLDAHRVRPNPTTLVDRRGVLKAPLSLVMTRRVSTCTEQDTVRDLMEQMTAGKFRHVPVLEQDRLVGIVSIGDVVKRRLGDMERESAALAWRSRQPPDRSPQWKGRSRGSIPAETPRSGDASVPRRQALMLSPSHVPKVIAWRTADDRAKVGRGMMARKDRQ